MDLAFHMTQEQTQRLVMTTQMQQALSVLEMSADELHQYVMDHAERNVFLDRDQTSVRSSQSKANQTSVVHEPSRGHTRTSPKYPAESTPGMENLLVSHWSLIDDIKHQLLFLDASAAERAWAVRLSGDLDENGYLGPYDPVLATRLHLDPLQWEAAVALIQRCEPVGIGARNLKECLLLQLNTVPLDLQPLVNSIISCHLDDIGSGRITQVARALKVSSDEVLAALEAVRKLNPRPGSAFSNAIPQYVRPDLSVIESAKGYAVVVNDALSDIAWQNMSYHKLMKGSEPEVRHYLVEQWREAKWIRKCVVQRTFTLQRIGEAIVRLQPEFLLRGFESLRPMRLRDVADELGIHESTVSRAVRHKILATPVGQVELRQLFSASLQGAEGDVSAAAIKHQIRDLIKSESSTVPLTDAAIASELQTQGITVSRRTVAKYRESMGIPGSMTRRMHASG